MTATVTPLDGGIVAISEPVLLDGRVSWMPPSVGGFQHVNCYLLVEPDGALLIDSGVAVHERSVIGAIREQLPKGTPLEVLMTRAEPDCIGNVAALGQELALARAYAIGILNPFDAFDVVSRAPDRAQVELARIAAGQAVPIGKGRSVVLIKPLLRVLATSWVYDARTRTLFTSDAFGYTTVETEDGDVIVNAFDDDIDEEDAARRLLAKFSWLEGALGVEKVQADLERIFGEYDVDVIAPVHGCVLRGAETIAAYYELTQSVLTHFRNGVIA